MNFLCFFLSLYVFIFIPNNDIYADVLDNITSIKKGMFQNNKRITQVILADCITEIPDYAFEGCTSLQYVKGNKISKIGKNAFRYCISLESVEVSNFLQKVDDYAFEGCTSLKRITSSSKNNNNFSYDIFFNPNFLCGLDQKAFIGDYAFNNCIHLEKITLRACGCDHFHSYDAFPRIGKKAFKGVNEIEAYPYDAEDVKSIIDSGTKRISINAMLIHKGSKGDSPSRLDNVMITVPEIDYFYFTDHKNYGCSFHNFIIESYAKESIFENIILESNNKSPLKLYSEKVELRNVNISSTGIAIVFFSNNVKLGLLDSSKIESKSQYSILSKKIVPFSIIDSRRGFLVTNKKIAICENKKDVNITILEEHFRQDNDTPANIVFDSNFPFFL